MRTFNDEVFGQLVWNEQVEWWECHCEFSAGLSVPVSVSPDDIDLETVLRQARQTFRLLQQLEPFPRLEAAKALLELHNEEWSDGEPINDEAFAGRMTMKELTIDGDGSATLFYDDGDLFWGHSILVEVDNEGAFQDASIAG